MSNNPWNSARLIEALEQQPDNSLVFNVNDTDIRPGYHVTEIKQAAVSSLDCQRGQEQWQEVIIQLLDGMALPTQQHMTTTKFLSIVKPSLANTESADRLYFEFAPGNRAFYKSTVDSVRAAENTTTIYLNTLSPECRPMTQALSSCCGSSCC